MLSMSYIINKFNEIKLKYIQIMNKKQFTEIQKLEIARKFKNIVFSPRANHISRTIKTFSDKTFKKNNQTHKKKIVIKLFKQPQTHDQKAKYNSTNDSCFSTVNTLSSISPFITQTTRQITQQNVNLKIKIKQFNPQLQQYEDKSIQIHHLQNLRKNNNVYFIHPFLKKISTISRVILIDWIMQLSEELQFTKEIVYNAIHYIDKYIEKQKIQKKQYQILGLASLSIAAKLEQPQVNKSNLLLQSMDGTCSVYKLIQMQEKILKSLKFKLNPPTLFSYFLLFLKIYDDYIKKSGVKWPRLLQKQNFNQYKMMSLKLDLIIMDEQYMSYSKQRLILSLLYMNLKHNKGNKKILVKSFNQYGSLQKQFNLFLKCVKIEIIDLKQTNAYIQNLMNVDLYVDNRSECVSKFGNQYKIRSQIYSHKIKEWILNK